MMASDNRGTLMTASATLPLVALAALAILAVVLLAAGLRGTGRIDVRRSVRVHAAPDKVWQAVGHLPDLHFHHGKTRELGGIESWSLRRGDGLGTGSVWRAGGVVSGTAYWAEIEVVRAEPPRVLEIALLADSLETQRGLRAHRGVLTLEPMEAGSTKVTWTLQAHLRGLRARGMQLLRPGRLHALLLDQGLRSIKSRVEHEAGDEPAATRAARPATGALPSPGPGRPDFRPPQASL